MYTGKDHRKTVRKDTDLPVKIIDREKVVGVGHIVNINCDGVKVKILFKTNEEKTKLKDILPLKEITLEIGEPGDALHVKTLARVSWSSFSCVREHELYLAGMEVKLNDSDKEKWQQYYSNLQLQLKTNSINQQNLFVI